MHLIDSDHRLLYEDAPEVGLEQEVCMVTLSKSINGNTYRIRSIMASTLIVLPLIVGCMYILVAIGKNLNEDAQVLFFFIGVPLLVGCSFIATLLMHIRLYHQNWPRGTYITAGLLASIVSILSEWFFMYLTSHFLLISDNLTLWMIILGTWLLTVPVTWMLFIPILHRRYNDTFVW